MTAPSALVTGLLACVLLVPVRAAGPAHVDITWMSISNVYYELGSLGILTDGYITRLPQSAFFGGGGGLAQTRQAFAPDVPAITRVMNAIGGPSRIQLLLTGHSHFDHSFDTGTWSRLTGARIIGSKTTCLQAEAQQVPPASCTTVNGGERVTLADGVAVRIIRWNHSGDSALNPEQHNPIELDAAPVVDPQTGGLRGGVAEDFPNGGGNRAYLFIVDGPDGRFSWFFQNSVSLSDIDVPIVVNGVDHGAPFANLQAALKAENLSAVDLWIGTANAAVARRLLPVLNPKAYLPVHWDGLWGKFETGPPRPYADRMLEPILADAKVQLLRPTQYMDKWRLDRSGARAMENDAIKKSLGFLTTPGATP
jgi:L-ascorbate metabolism protein UlaG (beta-lactamase superfamily)